MRVLVVDLNNFARYPTIAVGYLVAILRNAGMEVSVFSPLSTGVSGVVREPPVRPWSLLDQKLRYWSAVSSSRIVKGLRERVASMHGPQLARQTTDTFKDFQRCLRAGAPFDVVLISTYLMYYELCARICDECSRASVPVLVGGSYFSQPEVVSEWIRMSGLTALIGGEVEPDLARIVRSAAARETLGQYAGVFVPGAPPYQPAPPLQDLDSVPFPDYSDFPWHRYPDRIIPLISGRGCGWNACTFCSDVTSTAGRTYRSRSPDNVLEEIAYQSRRHSANLFVFTDLKLNSNLAVWNALLNGFQATAPSARWVGAVHVGTEIPNGLGARELQAARDAGLVRVTTGLESGSQTVLDRMAKGTDLGVTSTFLRDASNAGISVRTTMVLGYPGERAVDVEQSATYLEQHIDYIERVSLNRFVIMTGTRFHRKLEKAPQSKSHADLSRITPNHRTAQLRHHYGPSETREYRGAVGRLLSIVHKINRRPLRHSAQAFEGVM